MQVITNVIMLTRSSERISNPSRYTSIDRINNSCAMNAHVRIYIYITYILCIEVNRGLPGFIILVRLNKDIIWILV